MLEIYNDQVGADNVLQTCVEGTVRLEVEADGTARLVTEDALSYEGYGWDDDDDGGEGGKRSVPPAAPPPGHHATPRRAPRERTASTWFERDPDRLQWKPDEFARHGSRSSLPRTRIVT